MTVSEPPNKPSALQCRIARARLDGASDAFVMEHLAIDADTITEAWEFCRRAMTAVLAPCSFENGVMLTDHEITTRVGDCLRCLLDWEEQATRMVALDRAPADNSDSVDAQEEE